VLAIAEIVGLPPRELERPLEVRPERLKVVARARLLPDLDAERGRALALGHKLGRQLRRLREVAPRHPQQRRLV
jgi:hypothetical protein